MRLTPAPAFVDDTGTAKGRGVFAARAIAAGEVVECCAVLLLDLRAARLPETLATYAFNWSALAGVPQTSAVALGYGSLYNHANPANLRYEADREQALLRFVAVRPIAAGEELTINYNAIGGGAEWHDDSWFERMRIRPLA